MLAPGSDQIPYSNVASSIAALPNCNPTIQLLSLKNDRDTRTVIQQSLTAMQVDIVARYLTS